jgi:hypothetical protein
MKRVIERLGYEVTAYLHVAEALAALRADSAEVLERLDFLERVIAQKQPPPERQALASPEVPRPANPPVARIRTPV